MIFISCCLKKICLLKFDTLNNLAIVPDQYHRVGDDKMNKLLSSFFAHLISLFAAANASFFSVMGSNVAYTSNVEVAYELEKL